MLVEALQGRRGGAGEEAKDIKAGRAAPVKLAAEALGVHKRTPQFWLEGRVHSCNVNLSKLLKEPRRLGEEDRIIEVLRRDPEQHRAAVEALTNA